MTHPTFATQAVDASASARADVLLAQHQRAIWRRTDRLFAGLLACEWLAGIVIASFATPLTWEGARSGIHPHLWAALFLGGAIVSLPIYLAFTHPAGALTRHIIASAQLLMSALLIHLGGGRIEMHFHVFGSFAFLAFYRDWRVLITGIVIVTVDHLARGLLAPQSVYASDVSTGWRTLEHAGWVIFENVFLVAACVQAVREMRGIAVNQALLEQSYQAVELKIAERTQQLRDAQDTLVKTARTAGMAEIATSVLHNVGNVLNSVNVSANVIAEKLRSSELPTLGQVGQLMVEQKPNLAQFFTADERGQMLPDFIGELATCLAAEQQAVQREVDSLSKGIDHIKQIVAAQQSMAKHTSVRTLVAPSKLVESALAMQQGASRGGNGGGEDVSVTVVREFADLPAAALDEHRILQILINLISNARQAIAAHPTSTRRLTLGIAALERDGEVRLLYQVTDTGVGVAPEHLTRIFAHGFTTKKEGHGFGLHSAANAAREMGGSLTVHSDGLGRGATFTLELPLSTSQELAPCN